MGCVYMATCKTTGKSYIGKTGASLRRRKTQHNKARDSSIFHKAIQKYGKDDFEWKSLYDSGDEQVLFDKETEFVNMYNTMLPNGYNMTAGGKGIPRIKRPQSCVDKIVKKIGTGIYCVENKTYYPSMNIAAFTLNIAPTSVKLSVADSFRLMPKYHFCLDDEDSVCRLKALHKLGILQYGKHGYDEGRKRMGCFGHPPQGRIERARQTVLMKRATGNIYTIHPVINLTTGKVFPTISEASQFYNMKHPGRIGLCCKGKAETAYGYKWAYYTEESKGDTK